MSDRMKILYLVGTDPRNTSYGGEQRTHFIWEGLKKVADVYTVIPVGRKSQERVDETDRIRWFCFECRWTPGWFVRRVWSRFFPRIGLPCGCDMKRLTALYLFPFDRCVVRYPTMASYLRAWNVAPVCLDSDDLLTDDFDSWHSCRLTWHERVHRKLLDYYQNIVFGKARHIWVSNVNNLALLRRFPASCLPNIPPTAAHSFEGQANSGHIVIFVGLLAFDQNYLSIDRFLASTWDAVVNAFPDIIFKIVGGGLPQEYRDKWGSYRNVELMGFVQNLEPLFAESMAVIAPLYVGAGTSIKVLEALNRGRVCFVTPIAARGIPVETVNRENGLFLFERAEEMIDGLKALEDADRRLRFQRDGKAFVSRHYSQEKIDVLIKDTFPSLQQRLVEQQSCERVRQ
jgi:glycosyltransferase involved in cell wall biosynthesis